MLGNSKFPEELLLFLRRLEIGADYRIINKHANEEFIKGESNFFEPQKVIGELPRRVLSELNSSRVVSIPMPVKKGTLGALILDSDVTLYYPYLEPYLQAIMLEMIGLSLATGDSPHLARHIGKQDIFMVRDSILYVLDVLGVDPDYTDLALELQELYIDLGYVEAQVNNIKRDMEGKLSG